MVVDLWWACLTAADRRLLRLLDDTERVRVASLDRAADRGRSLLGAALLRVAVGTHRGVEPHRLTVDRTCGECGGPHGAPRVVGPGGTGPWVSVSHSGLLVVVALSAAGPVGVDVQRGSELADPRSAQEWACRESALKARTAARTPGRPAAWPSARAFTRSLPAPLEGYGLAVTTLGQGEAPVRWWHWAGAGS